MINKCVHLTINKRENFTPEIKKTNTNADELSREEDATDYLLDFKCFCYIDWLWGPSTDLATLKPNSWSGIAVDTATLVVRLVMHLRFPGRGITIGFFHIPCLFQRL